MPSLGAALGQASAVAGRPVSTIFRSVAPGRHAVAQAISAVPPAERVPGLAPVWTTPTPVATPIAAGAAEGPPSASLARRSAPVAGAVAALAALAALGLAGAARSTGGIAACAELARLPFPRFRILPCFDRGDPSVGAALASDTRSAGAGAASPGSADGATTKGAAGAPLGRPRSSGVLGAAKSTQAWKFLNTLLLAVLVAANTLLVAVRSKIARTQSR